MTNTPHPDRKERGRRLAEARGRAKLSQEDLAALAGFRKREDISRLETGRVGISYKNALRLIPHLKGEAEVDDLAFVASPSMLYLVSAIAEKLEIPLRPPVAEDRDALADAKTAQVRELVEKKTTDQPQQAEG